MSGYLAPMVRRVLAVKPEEERTTEGPRRRLHNKIKMFLKETGWEFVDRVHVAEDRKTVSLLRTRYRNLRLQKFRKFLI